MKYEKWLMEYEFRSLQKAQQKHHNFMSNITQPN